MYKNILLACAPLASVVSGSKHHEMEPPQLQQQDWNVAGTKALVKEFEGLFLKASMSPSGYLTIGWGHRGLYLFKGMTITKDQAETYLTDDLQNFSYCVRDSLRVYLNPNQVGALVSFAFSLSDGCD